MPSRPPAASASAWRRFWRSRARRRRAGLVARTALAAVLLAFALLPIAYVVSSAFNASGGLSGQRLLPRSPTLNNFQTILAEPYWRWMWNSCKLATIASLLSVAMTTCAAYAFSRFRFRLREPMLRAILLVQIFPALLNMVALYTLMREIGHYVPWLGLNSHGGLILLYLGGAMGINVWLMKGYLDSIPRDIDESGTMDGATHWQSFRYLILPLARPVVAVVAVLTFVLVYSDWVFASIVIQDQSKYTLMLGLHGYIEYSYSSAWGAYAAGALLGALPIVVLYLVLQDQIVGGLTGGAVKG